jgi:TRAP transporter TAXI family solute receptor
LLLIAVSVAAGCESAPAIDPVVPVRIATTNGAIGRVLAQLYNDHMPRMRAEAQPPETSRFNLRALQLNTADIGFVRADLAYAAYGRGTPMHPQPHDQLRGIAVMGMSLLHIVVKADSTVRVLADLKGSRVGLVSVSADAQERMTREGDLGFYRTLLTSTGQFGHDDISTVAMTTSALAERLASGDVAAGVILAAHPTPAPIFGRLAANVGVRLVEVEPGAAALIRSRFPFYKPALIPAGTYPDQHHPIRTVGVDFLLACRANLPEALVYDLVRTLFESLSNLADDGELGESLDPVLASATPIPLHPGAARYYRERELPHYE